MKDGALIPLAESLIASGFSVLPHKDKIPQGSWKQYQSRIMTLDEARETWKNGAGIGVVCGAISGNLESLDFDNPDKHDDGYVPHLPPIWTEFCELAKAHGEFEIIAKCYTVCTPSGGIQVRYRHQGEIKGNLKLARDTKGNALIETRGEGGYVADGPMYVPKRGSWDTLPILTAEERDFLIQCAMILTKEEHPIEVYKRELIVNYGDRPGDLFNKNGPSIRAMLEDEGWAHAFTDGRGREYMRRPGKNRFWSGTITPDGQVFYCFTSSAKFESNKGYSKFSSYAILQHHGDWHVAARAAKQLGYSSPNAFQRQDRIADTQKHAKDVETLDDDLVQFGDDFEYEELEFIWEPYLPRRKMILFDADGGVGKSSFLLAMAAGLSRGMLPNGEGSCDPVHTLYVHQGEDTSAELNTVYRANGGKTDGITYYDKKDLKFTPKGLDVLMKAIEKSGASVVPVDALFYFLSGMVGEGFNSFDISPIMKDLRAVYEETDSVGVHVRHTTKGQIGKGASALGLGSVQFRNSHRGQLVAQWHPDKITCKGLVVVSDEKGSILVPRGNGFAYKRRGNEVEYIHNFPDTKDVQAEQVDQRSLRGWMLQTIDPVGGMAHRDFKQEAANMGFSTVGGQFKRLRQQLTETANGTIRLKPECVCLSTFSSDYNPWTDS